MCIVISRYGFSFFDEESQNIEEDNRKEMPNSRLQYSTTEYWEDLQHYTNIEKANGNLFCYQHFNKIKLNLNYSRHQRAY